MPLPIVTLGVDGLQTTALGFGCAGLFRLSTSVQRSYLLAAAYDAGVRHFDVAPMYGLGQAESELGAFARLRRGEITIATKFGITPTLIARGLSSVQGPIRRAFKAKPAIRDQARQHAAGRSHLLYEMGQYSPARARRSLERSLRALRTDYVDLLLLHDPLPGNVRSDEISSYLEDARAAGLIRSWGIAGDADSTNDVARSFRRGVPVRQLRDNIFLQSLHRAPVGTTFITFGIILRTLEYLVQYVAAENSRRLRWERMIGADCTDPDIVASLLIRVALRDNSSGVVLFSTVHPTYIHNAVTALEGASSPGDSTLDAFLYMVDVELRKVSDTERQGS